MRLTLGLVIVGLIVQQSVAPPVSNNKEEEEKNKENEVETEDDSGIEYHRYLREVVDALETDPEFREKLQNAKEEDIKSGKIAHELERVNHHVRSKLDEIKRTELERLKRYVMKVNELEQVNKDHIDHDNPHTFEVDDLKKLITKTTQDLAEADKKRREEFKEYEMQKKFEEEEKLKALKDEEERKKYKEELEKMKAKHQKHEPLHHPGSRQQLEEVWEKQDHMGDQEFDPKLFFRMHDIDGNGLWDQDEVKALFQKELDKMYNEGAPEDDLVERAQEMENMRQHVFNEVDRDQNGMIDYNEFLNQAQKPDFNKDSGWESIDQQQIYTQEEFDAFARQRQEELQRHSAQQMPPQHDMNQQYYQNQMPQYQGQPQYPHAPQHQQQYQQVPPQHQQQQQQYQQVPPHHQQQQQYQQVPPQYQQQQQQQQYQMPPQNVPRDQIPVQHQYQGQIVQPVANHPPQVNSQPAQAQAVPIQNTQNPPVKTHDVNEITQNHTAPQQHSINEATKYSAVPQAVHV